MQKRMSLDRRAEFSVLGSVKPKKEFKKMSERTMEIDYDRIRQEKQRIKMIRESSRGYLSITDEAQNQRS